MPRPKMPRRLGHLPEVLYFKPQGVPLRLLDTIILATDELEAMKLYELDGLSQIESAEKMNISQPTFARILDAANKKVADAIVNGKAIQIAQVNKNKQ